MTTIQDVLRPAASVDRAGTLGDAYDAMRERQSPYVAVLDDGKLVGVLSEQDLLAHRVSLGFGERWREDAVAAVMTRSPRTVGAGHAIVDVAARMAAGRIGALPVIDADRTLLGLVTIADLLAADAPRLEGVAREPTAADVMTPGPFTATADENLLDASTRMSVHGIRHLPVVEDGDHVIGILSVRDVRTAVGDPARLGGAARPTLRVGDAMTRSPLLVTEDRPVAELAKIFQDRQLGALPVVDAAQHLVGIVSYVDALRALAQPQRRPPAP